MKRIIMFITLLLVFPVAVYADSISLDCPSEVAKGTDFTCNVIGDSTANIMSLKATVNASTGLSLVGFIPDSAWQGAMSDRRISLYTANDVTGKFKLGTLKLNGANDGNYTVTLSEVFYYTDEDTLQIGSVSKAINVKSPSASSSSTNPANPSSSSKSSDASTSNKNDTNNDNKTGTDSTTVGEKVETSVYLLDIIIDGYNLDFDKNTFDYELTIKDEKSLSIQPMLEDTSSKMGITGNSNLKEGSVITITVVDQYKEKHLQYNITIHKKPDTSYFKYIFIGIIGILVIINVVRIVAKSKKKVDGE